MAKTKQILPKQLFLIHIFRIFESWRLQCGCRRLEQTVVLGQLSSSRQQCSYCRRTYRKNVIRSDPKNRTESERHSHRRT
jgi:hypothetical protein